MLTIVQVCAMRLDRAVLSFNIARAYSCCCESAANLLKTISDKHRAMCCHQ